MRAAVDIEVVFWRVMSSWMHVTRATVRGMMGHLHATERARNVSIRQRSWAEATRTRVRRAFCVFRYGGYGIMLPSQHVSIERYEHASTPANTASFSVCLSVSAWWQVMPWMRIAPTRVDP